MRENGLAGACPEAKFKAHADKPDEAELPNIAARGFDGRAPRTHIVPDPACVRVGSKWNYVCLLVDLCNREIVGHAAGGREDARPMESAFAAVAFPLTDIQALHTDRGGEFDSIAIDGLLGAFGTGRSLPGKGCPYGNAVDESANKMPKAGFVYRESFSTLHGLQVEPNGYVHRFNHFRLHSKLGYVSPVEFGNAGLSL